MYYGELGEGIAYRKHFAFHRKAHSSCLITSQIVIFVWAWLNHEMWWRSVRCAYGVVGLTEKGDCSL